MAMTVWIPETQTSNHKYQSLNYTVIKEDLWHLPRVCKNVHTNTESHKWFFFLGGISYLNGFYNFPLFSFIVSFYFLMFSVSLTHEILSPLICNMLWEVAWLSTCVCACDFILYIFLKIML